MTRPSQQDSGSGILSIRQTNDDAEESRRLDEALAGASDQLARSMQQEERRRRERWAIFTLGLFVLVVLALAFVLLADPQWFNLSSQAPDSAIKEAIETDNAASESLSAESQAPVELVEDDAETASSESTFALESGDFTLRLPRGYEWPVTLQALNDGRYQLTSPRGLNMLGIYQRSQNMLAMAEPVDKRLTEFKWEVVSTDKLILVAEPPAAKTGATYLGATLTRTK